jgi:DNA-binding transcriptional regulator YhcF (GntR family)
MTKTELVNYLRDHIVGAMHTGQLSSGDRLPSIREVGKRLGRNERTIKAAYASLEQEGLVEVRGRSGVFVAPQQTLNGETSEESARWLSGVLVEAWKRRVRVQMLPDLMQRSTMSRRVRCALVESVEDAIVALKYELETEWGFDVHVVSPSALEDEPDAEFYVATSFNAALVHAAVQALGKPFIVLTVYPGLKDAINEALRYGSLTVVGCDPRFADRIRIGYSPDEPARIRFVAADDAASISALDPTESVLLTRAARQKIGSVNVPTIFPHSPTISPETARALAMILVRKNVEAAP